MNEITDVRDGRPSASGFERLVLCPGSWLAEQACRVEGEPESEAAAMGTRLTLLAPDQIAAAQLRLDAAHLLAHLLQMAEKRGRVLELASQNPVANHNISRPRRIASRVTDAAAVHNRQPAAGHALLSENLPALPIPSRIVRVAGTKLRRHLLNPRRIQQRNAAHPEPRRLHQLRPHHPIRALLAAKQPRARENRKIAPARPAVNLVLRAPDTELQRSARQQRAVNALRRRLLLRRGQLRNTPPEQLPQRRRQILHQIMPLDNPQKIQKMRRAPSAQPIAAQTPPLAKLQSRTPERKQRQKITLLIPPHRMRAIRLLRRLRRPLARIHDTQPRDNHQHLRQRLLVPRLKQHAPLPRIERQPSQMAPRRRQLSLAINRPDLPQRLVALADKALARRIRQRKLTRRRQFQIRHAQNHPRERTPANLRIRKRIAALKIRLRIQPDADTLRDAPAASRPLAGTRLRNRLHLQALNLAPRQIARNASQPAVNHINNTRNRQRRLRHIRRQHKAPPSLLRIENALLFPEPQTREERQHIRPRQLQRRKRIGAIPNLALPRQKHQHIPPLIILRKPRHRTHHMLRQLLILRQRRHVVVIDTESAPLHIDNRSPVEKLRKRRRIHRRRRNNELDIAAPLQQQLHVAEQKINIQTALVRFVNNNRVIAAQIPIRLRLRQQNTVRHHLETRLRPRPVIETHLIAHVITDLAAHLIRNAASHRHRRQSARLRAAQHPRALPRHLQRNLGQLCRLAAARLTHNNHHAVAAQSLRNLLAATRNRQIGIAKLRQTLRRRRNRRRKLRLTPAPAPSATALASPRTPYLTAGPSTLAPSRPALAPSLPVIAPGRPALAPGRPARIISRAKPGSGRQRTHLPQRRVRPA